MWENDPSNNKWKLITLAKEEPREDFLFQKNWPLNVLLCFWSVTYLIYTHDKCCYDEKLIKCSHFSCTVFF